jgi:hypothetical protein
MKKFYLYPYIYYSANVSDEILLYNTKTGAIIENSFLACRQLIEDIYDPEKLGVIDFSEKYLSSSEVVEFVRKLAEEDFGQLIDVKPGMPQLVNLLPILNLQDDVERLKKDKKTDIGEKALQYLNELNIYLNNQCRLNCPHCDLYFKQTKSCFNQTTNVHIQLLVENDLQYEDVNLILNKTNINNYQITPIYTGSNISFFETNVYLTKKDILAMPIPHRIIFCNQKLNSNFFGKLYILSDGTVKANMNTDVLGNIDENSLLKIIEIELNKNTAWRKIRNSKPCNDCLYQYLCPPPSNYETVIGKSYLCHVKI